MASIPALLTTTSRPPSSDATCSTTAAATPASVMSPAADTARPPAVSISRSVRSIRSASRPPTATAAPSRAKRTAIARPIPLDAPVTSAFLPCKLGTVVSLAELAGGIGEAPGGGSAVYDDLRAGDVGGLAGQQEGHDGGHLFRLPDPAHGCQLRLAAQPLLSRQVRGQRRVRHRRLDDAG